MNNIRCPKVTLVMEINTKTFENYIFIIILFMEIHQIIHTLGGSVGNTTSSYHPIPENRRYMSKGTAIFWWSLNLKCTYLTR